MIENRKDNNYILAIYFNMAWASLKTLNVVYHNYLMFED